MRHMDVGFVACKTAWPTQIKGMTLSELNGTATRDKFVFFKASGASKLNLEEFEHVVWLQGTHESSACVQHSTAFR